VAAGRKQILKRAKLTIGLDLGDRASYYCILDEAGNVIWKHSVPTTSNGIRQAFSRIPRCRIALKTGMHSPWVSRQLARIDPGLLGPVRHRSAQAQIQLTVIRARAVLVCTRAALVNAARGLTKSYGERLKKCGTEQMNRDSSEGLSQKLREALDPLLREIESLNERIAEYDRRIEQIVKEVHPEVSRLK
jgi:transposase